MINKIESLLMVIGIAGAFPIMIYIFYLMFKYPDITQIRFFLTFWKEELAFTAFILLIGAGYIHKIYRLGKESEAD
jgi:hypothetical protein